MSSWSARPGAAGTRSATCGCRCAAPAAPTSGRSPATSGAALGVGGHLTALRRTAVGPFGLDRARTLDAAGRDDLELVPMRGGGPGRLPGRRPHRRPGRRRARRPAARRRPRRAGAGGRVRPRRGVPRALRAARTEHARSPSSWDSPPRKHRFRPSMMPSRRTMSVAGFGRARLAQRRARSRPTWAAPWSPSATSTGCTSVTSTSYAGPARWRPNAASSTWSW